jgi:hypothetical protein
MSISQSKLIYGYLISMRKFYRLSFEIEAKHDDDVISIAYGVPYSFTTLTKYLKQIEN